MQVVVFADVRVHKDVMLDVAPDSLRHTQRRELPFRRLSLL